MSRHPLQQLIARQKAGAAVGVWSACTAHRTVLEACLQQAAADGCEACIESTCNQVDQFGGYSGMTPVQFVEYVRGICRALGFPFERVILGGDHLGPNPWRHEPATTAMPKAQDLVRAYVLAGYTKIHLDASMCCEDDRPGKHGALEEETVAVRAADLCAAAESARAEGRPTGLRPVYIIGTEVPIPGGAQEVEMRLQPTTSEAVAQTVEVTRSAFRERGLADAWERVVGVVVQPGVEFSDSAVAEYRREAAAPLRAWIARQGQLVFEAHSTDYQSGKALRELVEDQFAILKVGPGLTYAYREGLFALEDIEREWLGGKRAVELSHLRACLEAEMLSHPGHWQSHYHGDDQAQALSRMFSYSDRCRYYWHAPAVQSAVNRLLDNLQNHPPPLTLVSQYLPAQYQAVRAGRLAARPLDWLRDKVEEVTALYSSACGQSR